ncbi:MAG: hypothetical protein ACI8RY_001798 [Urechidicola sp.]|jgi:hypothetical protein
MHLILDTRFLDDFYLEFGFEKENRAGYNKLYELFSRFTELKITINLNDKEELEKYKETNPIIEKLQEYNPQFNFILNLSTVIDNYALNQPALAFVKDDNDWCEEKTKANIIVSNITTFEENMIELLEVKREYDLSVNDENDEDYLKDWGELSYLSNYTEEIMITDNYILKDQTHAPIRENLVKFINSISGLNQSPKKLKLFVNFFKGKLEEENIIPKLRLLNTAFANLKIKVEIINIDEFRWPSKEATIHDRFCYSNFYLIEVGSGFSLYNRTGRNLTDSTFRINSLIERKAYNRWKKRTTLINRYYDKITDPKVIGKKMYCYS